MHHSLFPEAIFLQILLLRTACSQSSWHLASFLLLTRTHTHVYNAYTHSKHTVPKAHTLRTYMHVLVYNAYSLSSCISSTQLLKRNRHRSPPVSLNQP